MRIRHGRAWFWTVLTVAILVVYLFPVYWMLSASLQPHANSTDTQWFPTDPGLDGYVTAFTEGLGGLRVSIVTAIGTVLFTLIVAVPAAYSLSRLKSRAVSVALVLLLLAQMIPSIMLANSFYAMFNTWGILNSYVGLILANSTAGIPFAIILLRSFMMRLDHEVSEAATLDGLGLIGVLWRIVIPLSRNAIITAGVFTFLFAWGDLLFGLTVVTQTQMYPMTVFIYSLANASMNTWSATMAASLVASLPALALVLAAQRYVKDGMLAGSSR